MKHIVLTIAIFVLSFSFTNAQSINVADYGIVPGKDVTMEVNALMESLKGKENLTISFPKGQYEFHSDNATEIYRAVTNHDNSLKKLAFPMFDLNNITIDGNGSTFMFHGMICPFVLEKSSNITLKNFSIDFNTPFHDELVVVERDEKNNSFVVEIDTEQYPYTIKNGVITFNHEGWNHGFGQNITFDPKTKSPIWNTRQYAIRLKNNSKATKVSENRVRLSNMTKTPPPVGAVIINYGLGRGENRFVPAIHASNSKDTKIENITVYAAGGMAVIAERCENIHLDKFVVTSTENRIVATRADATHFLGCKGVVTLENSRLEHMLDDGINVHGAYVKVEKYLGKNQFLCEISHFQQTGLIFAEAGDKINIISRSTILPLFETTVKDFKILNEKRMVVTLAEIPEEMPKGLLSLENLTWYPDLVMKNNQIRDNRARSALISTKGKVLVENNYFSSQMHGILIEGDNNKWYESGGVQDITIINNTFENIGYGNGLSYPLYVAPLLRPEQHTGDDQYHYNINFSNNKLISFNGHLVHAFSVKNLVIKENTIEVSDKYPTGSPKAAIELDFCENVQIQKNKFNGFDWDIKVDALENTTNVKVKKNKGMTK